VEVNELSQGR